MGQTIGGTTLKKRGKSVVCGGEFYLGVVVIASAAV
jgi:hypothetical protein